MTGADIHQNLTSLMVWAEQAPLAWIALTLGAFVLATWIAGRTGNHPLANTVMMSVALVSAALWLAGARYEDYFRGAQFIHFLLGPATVALAIPLVENIALVKRALLPIVVALIAGALTAIVSAVGFAWALGGSPLLLASLAPKSVTAPIAMSVGEVIGGLPALAMVATVSTGILGAMIGRPLFDAMKIRDPAARGFAMGLAAHGIGTARAFQSSEVAGAFASVGMALNGMLTALLLPALAALLR
ncbi:LrgB family protein [Camelimonas sp. ID_303_24]